jgi:SAM-dependent methyltransferase
VIHVVDIAGWEERYRSGASERCDEAPTILLVETLAKLGGVRGRAIDLACGAGRNALYLAKLGWTVTAVDGSATAIGLVAQGAAERGLRVETKMADLTAADFQLPRDSFDLVVTAYYLQRDLFDVMKQAVRPGGLVLAIVHTAESEADVSYKRAAAGELRTCFAGWDVWHDYEGPSRDPAHHRPVAEIVARRI